MTGMPAAGDCTGVRPARADGHRDLVATLNRGQEAGDDHLGACQQQEDVLLHPWVGRLGQDRRITIAGIWRRPLT